MHEDNINRIAAARITVGCSAPTDNPPWGDLYCPDDPVTRRQMASFLARALNLPAADQDYFVDDEGSVHEDNINRVAAARITVGCSAPTDNPPWGDRYCPDDPVTRRQMASFLARALDLPAADQDYFVDDEGSVHEDNINRIAAARITVGCSAPTDNPPWGDRYCPDDPVRRSQMASFLARAFLSADLPAEDQDYFVDDEGSVHEDNINRIAAARITVGCSAPTDNPPWGDRYCPDDPVRRSQMASFLARAFLSADLPAEDQDYFVDDEGSVHEDNINRIAAARITVGCSAPTDNPPWGDRYCPDDPVRRSQMASFLARALNLPAADQDYFVDDEGSVHEDNINRVAAARITVGCSAPTDNPPSGGRYCPDDPVTRSQMASFLARALNLS